jgi:hypothetical protein
VSRALAPEGGTTPLSTITIRIIPCLAGARVLPSLESDLGMALRPGRDTDSNPESRGDFPPCLCSYYFTPGGVKLCPLKRVSYI